MRGFSGREVGWWDIYPPTEYVSPSPRPSSCILPDSSYRNVSRGSHYCDSIPVREGKKLGLGLRSGSFPDDRRRAHCLTYTGVNVGDIWLRRYSMSVVRVSRITPTNSPVTMPGRPVLMVDHTIILLGKAAVPDPPVHMEEQMFTCSLGFRFSPSALWQSHNLPFVLQFHNIFQKLDRCTLT